MNEDNPSWVPTVKDLLHQIICKIVDKPDEVNITELKTVRVSIFEIRVADEDVGKIIGKKGRTATALRAIFESISGTAHRKYIIEILEP